jgi:hypothetical protein
MINKLDKWHKTRLGLLVFVIVELTMAYVFGSLAIARGNWLWYLLMLVLLVGSLQNLFKLIGKIIHVGQAGKAK